MKKEIFMLIIGILIGAIIATGVFLVLKGNDTQGNGARMEMRGDGEGEPPSMDGNTTGERGARNNTDETNNNSEETEETNTSNVSGT